MCSTQCQRKSIPYLLHHPTGISAGPDPLRLSNGKESSTCSWGPWFFGARIFPLKRCEDILLCRRARIHGNCCLADNCAAALCTDGKHGSVSLRVNSTVFFWKSRDCRSGVSPLGRKPTSSSPMQPRTWSTWRSPADFQTHPNHILGFISNQSPIYIPFSHSISHYIYI